MLFIWEFNTQVNFAVTGYEASTRDLKGEILQDLLEYQKIGKTCFYDSLSRRGESYCIISWLKENNDFFLEFKKQLTCLTGGGQLIRTSWRTSNRLEEPSFDLFKM